MKGAILKIAPTVPIVDINHHIAPGDIRSGAFNLMACYRTFPPNTIFCVVVDPGVGSSRQAVVIKTDRYFFIGPDNGVLNWALRYEKNPKVYKIENKRFIRKTVSATFHGRDIFGPVAAHLIQHVPISIFGTPTSLKASLQWPRMVCSEKRLQGVIIYIDHFGNAITNIEFPHINQLSNEPTHVHHLPTDRKIPIHETFSSVEKGTSVAYIGSSGFVEIGINSGSAANKLGVTIGDIVEIRER